MSRSNRPLIDRRRATIASSVCACLVLLLIFLGPGSFRVWSSQRHQSKQLHDKISALDTANRQLTEQIAQLKSPEAIREVARSEYGMVPKGSQAFAILPTPSPDVRPGGTWPFIQLQSSGGNRPSR